MSSPHATDCPSCGAAHTEPFYEIKSFPVHSTLNLREREKALEYRRGAISLAFCRACGFIFNALFDQRLLEYCSECEETQGFSPTFNAFARKLAADLVERHALRGKKIIEIGCGKGEFLTLLCEMGGNHGTGFDPAFVQGRNRGELHERLVFVKDYYSEKYTGYEADFICCRMTLEHIPNVAEFLGMVRRSIGNRSETVLFLQVPDVTRILEDCCFEDVYYEHCSYFSPGSLAGLLRRSGFRLLDLRTEYDGQYLVLEAKPALEETPHPTRLEEDLGSLQHRVTDFRSRLDVKLNNWKEFLKQTRRSGARVVLWGSGSKAVAFLSVLGVQDQIQYVVDINPYRHGTYMAGTGQTIVGPDFLAEYKPETVVIMNPVYREEIERDLDRMGLAPKILTL